MAKNFCPFIENGSPVYEMFKNILHLQKKLARQKFLFWWVAGKRGGDSPFHYRKISNLDIEVQNDSNIEDI
jgi:hypothetical protein